MQVIRIVVCLVVRYTSVTVLWCGVQADMICDKIRAELERMGIHPASSSDEDEQQDSCSQPGESTSYKSSPADNSHTTSGRALSLSDPNNMTPGRLLRTLSQLAQLRLQNSFIQMQDSPQHGAEDLSQYNHPCPPGLPGNDQDPCPDGHLQQHDRRACLEAVDEEPSTAAGEQEGHPAAAAAGVSQQEGDDVGDVSGSPVLVSECSGEAVAHVHLKPQASHWVKPSNMAECPAC